MSQKKLPVSGSFFYFVGIPTTLSFSINPLIVIRLMVFACAFIDAGETTSR